MAPRILFEISLTGDSDGRLRAAYIHLRKTKVSRTREIVEDMVLADYDSQNRLVGIEILGPVKIQILARLIDKKDRSAFRRFAKENIPVSLLQQAA